MPGVGGEAKFTLLTDGKKIAVPYIDGADVGQAIADNVNYIHIIP